MRLSEAHLRQLIRGILQESGTDLPPVDEPAVNPDEALGRYVMPDLMRPGADRATWAKIAELEPNTQLERLLAAELMNHYEAGMADFTNIWEPLMGLVRAGLYRDILVPPAGTAYRLMKVNPRSASRILGITEDDLRAQPGVARRAPSPPPWKGRQFVTSWTIDPLPVIRRGFGRAEDGKVTVMLTAQINPGDGHFLMNPTGFSERFQLGSQFSDEAEVIGGGIIPLESAVWIWWPGPEDPGYFDEENPEDPGYDRKGKATSRHWKNIGQALLAASEDV